MLFAFGDWLNADYPEMNPFRFLGQFEGGVIAILQTQLIWLRVAIVGALGMLLFQSGRSLINNETGEQ
ncbi:hypothetical protein [Pseudophaeobacter sp.]|uniref:hypothetical protein n=1 Tax=Pseudophaeobacter sp. TaxID=1971739 RepID=UPI00329949C2